MYREEKYAHLKTWNILINGNDDNNNKIIIIIILWQGLESFKGGLKGS